jgi:hypothetical protein
MKSEDLKKLLTNENEDFVSLNAIYEDLNQMMMNNFL